MVESAKVFIKVNENNCVVDIDSDKFLKDTMGWVQIDEGTTDKHFFAKGNYLSKPLFVQPNVCRYKYVDGVISERTAEEIQADIESSIATTDPTAEERLAALEGVIIGMLEI